MRSRRKIIKIGDSVAVTLPPLFLEDMDISVKEDVELEYNTVEKTITIRGVCDEDTKTTE